MPKYEVQLDVPLFGDAAALDKFMDGLREYGYPILTVEIEAKSRAEAAKLLAESTETYAPEARPGSRFSKEWWLDRLQLLRGKRLAASAEMVEDRR